MFDFIFEKIFTPILFIITALVTIFIIGFLVCGSVELYRFATCEKIEKEITEVGGCNRYQCGVRYNDGTTGNESSPVVGEIVRMCK